MTFWDKDKKRQFSGHIHIGPTSCTHCTSCDGGARPLARGIAVHFTDQEGKALFTTGPECFKKHTDISSLSKIPTIGFGFSDVSLGRSRISSPLSLAGGFKGAAKGIDAAQEAAYANVLLRAKILPAMGFHMGQPGLIQFLNAPFPYSADVLDKINRYVENGVAHHRKPSLDQLCRAHYVAHQVEALKGKRLTASDSKYVQSFDDTLKQRFGLTDRQMEVLESISKRHNILLQEVGIRFPENQRRFEGFIVSKL